MSHERVLTFRQMDRATTELREALAMISCVAARNPDALPEPVSTDQTMHDTTEVAGYAMTRVRRVLELMDAIHGGEPVPAEFVEPEEEPEAPDAAAPRTREQLLYSLESARAFVDHLQAELAAMDADQ